jgi:CheY-like chemotaxis protein
LDYNKIEANKYTFEQIEMDILAVLNNAVKSSLPIAQKKGIDLHAEFDANVPKTVLGDPTKLGQVINNLINNAIKFTSKGFVKLRVVNLGVKEGKVQLSIGVEDSGIGIATDKLETIFDPFSQADSSITRHFGGTGLGLTICKQILEAQDVQLRVKSKVQEGSNFYFVQSFAIVENATGQTTVQSITEKQLDEIEMKGLHVLLVDDNELNLKVANIFLHRWGAKVEMAYNGKEAIEKYAKGNYDLILMDIQMPEMDGLEATKILRMQGSTCPIIALTANVGTEIYDEAIAAGMNDLLVKPFKPNDLKMAILKYASSYKEAYL